MNSATEHHTHHIHQRRPGPHSVLAGGLGITSRRVSSPVPCVFAGYTVTLLQRGGLRRSGGENAARGRTLAHDFSRVWEFRFLGG
jgi:hypothetical protein